MAMAFPGEVAGLLAASVVLANLPFVNERVFAIGPRLASKHLGWRLAELVLACGVFILAGTGLEWRIGQVHPQRWEFYAATACLFLTLAFPGYVWRYLRRRRSD